MWREGRREVLRFEMKWTEESSLRNGHRGKELG